MTPDSYLGPLVMILIGFAVLVAVAILEYAADRSQRLNDWLDRIIERLEQ